MLMARASCFILSATLFPMMYFSVSFGIFNNITTDQSTLLVLKNHITTDPHNVLAENWTSTTSVCGWIGVTCGSRHHRVTALNISNMGLTGTIPAQMGNLSFLVYLDMSNNNFHGNLPEELSSLRRLRVINLNKNSFTGFIPPSLSNISKLEILILSSNLLQGNIPQEIGNLSNLKVFAASDNRFVGALPSGIGSLKMLEFLYLGRNSFEGIIPQEISNLYKLEVLELSNNSLSGSIPVGIFNISTLGTISMGINNLSGTLPSTMGHRLPNLEYLLLFFNSLTGQMPESISNSSKLNIIALEFNIFTGPIPISFGNLRLLRWLHLFRNNLTNDPSHQELSFITSLTNCPNLERVAVSANPLDGLLPTSIGNLSTSVKDIYASSCKIRGNIPDEVGNVSNLMRLDLRHNDLSGFVPRTFHGLQKLQGLFLGHNKIRGPFPTCLCDLPKLSYLNLSQNQISGPIPDCMGNVTSLREIDFASNRLTSSIPFSMWNLKDLLKLDLSSNSLSGSLPQEVENLKVAFHIDLSRNGFTGVIPNASGSGSMQSLINFSLASNKLQGSIPQSFGKMVSLERLDLSDNNLSGEIPKSLEGLQSLKYFNVSFNKLRGEIPSGGPFNNFTYLLFVSNEALCGAPELHVRLCHSSSSHRTRTRRILILVISVIIASLILTMMLVFSWIMRHRRKVTASEEADPFQSTITGRFSYKQIQRATDGFSQANLLGTGSFGSVYRASLETGMVFAVKVFNLQLEYAAKSFETECEMLSKLRHRNLTKVISACSNLDFKALILEYMQNGSLEEWLYNSDGDFVDMMQRLDIMIDVASALEYLHHGYIKPVIHCDLKPSNILLDEDMVGHVTDFGITKLLGKEESIVHTETLATLGYMAPEYGTDGLVSSACDVYSFGILLMETFTRRRPNDNMFGGELSLRSWINASLPNSISRVVDSNLMREEEEHFTEKMQCVSLIIALAMDCTVESPKDRVNMKNVLTALKKIKVHFTAMLG